MLNEHDSDLLNSTYNADELKPDSNHVIQAGDMVTIEADTLRRWYKLLTQAAIDQAKYDNPFPLNVYLVSDELETLLLEV